MNNHLIIKGEAITGEKLEGNSVVLVGDYINLDHLMVTSSEMGEEYLKEHCPLRITSVADGSIEVVDDAGEKIEIKKGSPVVYEFKDRKLELSLI